MRSLLPLFLLLHVLSISAWLAAALWLAGDLRRTLALGKPHVDALRPRLAPELGLDAIAAVATFATGVLVMWAQGFAPPRPGVAAGLVLAVARAGVLASLRRRVRGILARLDAGEAVPPTDPAARRAGALAGVAHGLWLLALAGMVLPF